MKSYAGLSFKVTAVESVRNKVLREQFGRSMSYFYTQDYPSAVKSVYHGTHPKNIDSILQSNLKRDTSVQLDPGWFGAGFYFSQYADYTMLYRTTGQFRPVCAGDNIKLLRFDILPGRSEKLGGVALGADRKLFTDSHISPLEFEYVMFDARHINPTHVIHVAVTKAPGLSFEGSPEHVGPAGAGVGAAAAVAAPAAPPAAAADGVAAVGAAPIAPPAAAAAAGAGAAAVVAPGAGAAAVVAPGAGAAAVVAPGAGAAAVVAPGAGAAAVVAPGAGAAAVVAPGAAHGAAAGGLQS
jgi:hypothetical protein